MERLLNRQRMVDAVYDARLPDWTLRKAWRDISDGLERGALFSTIFCVYVTNYYQKLMLGMHLLIRYERTL